MTDIVYIYALVNPLLPGKQVVYVGACSDPVRRLTVHNRPGAQTIPKLRDIVRECRDACMKLGMEVLQTLPYIEDDNGWRCAEAFWIKEFRRRGHPLCNRMVNNGNRLRVKPCTTERYRVTRAEREDRIRRKFAVNWRQESK